MQTKKFKKSSKLAIFLMFVLVIQIVNSVYIAEASIISKHYAKRSQAYNAAVEELMTWDDTQYSLSPIVEDPNKYFFFKVDGATEYRYYYEENDDIEDNRAVETTRTDEYIYYMIGRIMLIILIAGAIIIGGSGAPPCSYGVPLDIGLYLC